jgi:hypothetical protein
MSKEPAKVATVKVKNKTYSVSLNNPDLRADLVPNPYWWHSWAHIPKRTYRALGVRADEYRVTLDGDSRWLAIVTLDGIPPAYDVDDSGMIIKESRTAPTLNIATVNVRLGAQTELALPLRNILAACIKVGTVTGTVHPADNQNPYGYITADLTSTGHYMTPDDRNELMGNPRRLPASSIEQQQEALRAAITYKADLAAERVGIDPNTGALTTVYQYVTDATDIKDGKTLLRKARENPELRELAEQSRIRKAKK